MWLTRLSWDSGSVAGSTTTYTATAISVNAGNVTFSESNVAGYTEGTWGCTGATATGTAYNAGSVTVPNGGTVVCTITNNDDKASPGGSTAQTYTISDSLTMSGMTTGASTPGSLTFRLWQTKTGSVCSDQVGSDVVVSNIIANTQYAMPSGISVSSGITYYWTVQYSGDEFNNGFTTSCGSESTTISKTE